MMGNSRLLILVLSLIYFSFSQSTVADTDDEKKIPSNVDWANGSIVFQSHDKEFALLFDVRAYIDYARYMETDNYLTDGWNLRRARFAMKAQLWKNWFIEYDMDIAGDAVKVKDMYIMNTIDTHSSVKIGNFKPAFSLEELTTSRYVTFIERAYNNEFTPGRRTGLGFTHWQDNCFFSATAYGLTIEDRVAFNKSLKKKKKFDEKWGFAGRASYVPLNEQGKILHFGLSGSTETLNTDKQLIEFDIRPESKVSNSKFLKTGDLIGANRVTYLGGEFAVVYNNLSIQSEYILSIIDRIDSKERLNFSGIYTYVSYFLFGAERKYKSNEGEFGQIHFLEEKKAALELLFRYSYINLDHKDIKGGKAANITFGLSYYPNYNIKFMINFTMVDNSATANREGKFPGNYDFNYLAFRSVFFF